MPYNNSAETQSFYLHWPFCPYKCHFCPFVALASHDHFMEQYHRALMDEIKQFSKTYNGTRNLNTIFLGGGTPSTYPNALLAELFQLLHKEFSISDQTEISIEVNPGTVCKEQLVLWQQLGINRLSIGVQSIKDQVLQKLNRLQSTQQVHDLLRIAPNYCDTISVDLILGLPEVTQDEWKALIEQVVTWPIKHVSVYFLTVHEDTPLYFKVTTNRVTLPSDETMVSLYEWTVDRLAQHGFERYELSNFARPGYESRHNSVYWERKPYKAFGLGACSFDGSERFQNEKNLMKYMESIASEKDSTIFSERLTPDQIHLERLMLGLRRKKGVGWQQLIEYIPTVKQDRFAKTIHRLKEKKLLAQKGDIFFLTTAGMVVENEIIAQLS